MIDTLKIYTELSQTMDSSSAKKIAETIGLVYRELQNTVTKTEFNELKEVVKELAEAQRRTEARVEELAEAQKRTEEEVRSLAKSVRELQKQVGGLSNTIGYELEDKFYLIFPKVLKEDFGVEIEGELRRQYIVYPSGKDDEINIFGEGRVDGRQVYIIGESKAQIGKSDIKDFDRLLKRVKAHLQAEIIPIMLCYSIHPAVEEFIREKYSQIRVYKSYELIRKGQNLSN